MGKKKESNLKYALASFIFAGAGQLWKGDTNKCLMIWAGIILSIPLLILLIGFFTGPAIYLINIIDAYTSQKGSGKWFK
jgi:TM2 domain-containing membrane protein YozV